MRAASKAGIVAWVAWVALVAGTAAAQVAVNPTGVNVRQAGPSTVFLTFRNVMAGQTVGEGLWCAELNPDNSCVAGTIFGRLPSRLDLSQRDSSSTFTDIMTIPPSVTRRAYQRAQSGLSSVFFYVREFSGPSEFVPVTCRLSGGGSRAPLAIVDIQLVFENDALVQYVPRGSPPTPYAAEIKYSGSGRLRGRWEIVRPGDPQPTMTDLLPEGSLPMGERASRQRYQLIERFDVVLPPAGSYTLPGPDPARFRPRGDGLYQILLRIEASDTPFSRSDTGTSITNAGGVAGFAIPPLRFFVGTASDAEQIETAATGKTLQPLAPRPGQRIPSGQPVVFHWLDRPDAVVYELNVRAEGEEEYVLSALVPPSVGNYTAPPFLSAYAGKPIAWRVVAMDEDGDPIVRSEWTSFAIEEP